MLINAICAEWVWFIVFPKSTFTGNCMLFDWCSHLPWMPWHRQKHLLSQLIYPKEDFLKQSTNPEWFPCVYHLGKIHLHINYLLWHVLQFLVQYNYLVCKNTFNTRILFQTFRNTTCQRQCNWCLKSKWKKYFKPALLWTTALSADTVYLLV